MFGIRLEEYGKNSVRYKNIYVDLFIFNIVLDVFSGCLKFNLSNVNY